jgi:hypothetical protein
MVAYFAHFVAFLAFGIQVADTVLERVAGPDASKKVYWYYIETNPCVCAVSRLTPTAV